MQKPKTLISLVDVELTRYCEQCTSEEPDLCKLIREQTRSHEKAHWISGPIVGTFLRLLVSGTNAQDVLDIGTFVGYSAIYMASAHPRVTVVSLERNDEFAGIARSYIQGSSFEKQICVRAVDVNSWIEDTPLSFDLIFFDSDRTHVMALYEPITRVLRPGGFLIMDNACLRRHVLHPSKPWEIDTARFNASIQMDERFLATILPIRDGLLLAQKLLGR